MPAWTGRCHVQRHLPALFDHSSWTVYAPSFFVCQAQMSSISPLLSSYQSVSLGGSSSCTTFCGYHNVVSAEIGRRS